MSNYKNLLTVALVILLVLFGVIEYEAITTSDRINEIFAGLGIIGSIITLWLRSRV